MTKSICVAVLALGVLGALEPDVAAADEVLLYDVDFGSPPHTVGLPPVTGSGAAPRETPTSIPFGDPTVVSALAGLTDQPCAFGNGTFGYDQLQFRIGGTHEAVLEDQDLIRIEMDVVISSLESGNFTILCDVPDVHNVIFHPGGTIGSLPSGLLAFYEYDIPVHVTIEIGFFAPSQWKVYLDGELVFTHPYTGSFFESLRVNLTGENETDAVAIDNLRVYGTNHVCCLGEECIITNERDCEGLGGVHHRELDSCSPDNPCGPPTPVEDRSWGAIKAIHR